MSPREALNQIVVDLRNLVRHPSMHTYPCGKERRDYVTVERVREIADRLDRVLATMPWIRLESLLALVAERDDWKAATESWQAAYELTSNRCLALEQELASAHTVGRVALGATLELASELVDAEAEAEGLAQAMRDEEEVLDLLSKRLIDRDRELRELLEDLWVDHEDIDSSELISALRTAVKGLERPRRSLLSRLFGRFA